MKTNIWIMLFVLFGGITGCNKEGGITPTAEPETFDGIYVLPQGNHDYDSRIVELSQKYNTRIYYKFVEKDYYWGVSSDIRWVYDTTTKRIISGYEAEPADENYVGDQLDLLATHFLNYFPDTLLSRVMPFKILLTSKFNFVAYGGVGFPEVLPRTLVHAYSGYDYLGFNWGNADVTKMTAENRNAFKGQATAVFLQRLADKGLITRSSQFTAVTNYATAMTAANMYEFGIIYYNERTINGDWRSYVEKIVSTPYEQLIAPGGILSPEVDKKALIRKKYDFMTSHFKEVYNIDLQAIGNDVKM